MTVASLPELLSLGGGRVEFLFTVGGVPWGSCTSTQLATQLDSDIETKRIIFGGANDNDSPPVYFADDVPIIPNMRPPGEQRVEVDQTKGLKWESMTIELDSIDHGADFSKWIDSSTTYGLPGVDVLYNQWADSGIAWGRVAEGFTKDATSFEIYDESDSLESLIDTNAGAGDYTFVWVGQECIALDSTPGGSVANAFAARVARGETSARGAFRSRPAGHYTDLYDVGISEYVSTVPLNGISGRFGYIWAFVCNEDCTEYSEPYMIHHGRIADDITPGADKTSVTVAPWIDALDTPLRPVGGQGSLAKYVLSRGGESTDDTKNSDLDAAAHLVLFELDSGTWYRRNVWLCAQDSTVTFDTLDDLIDAIDDELRRVSAGAGATERAAQLSGNGTADNPDITCLNEWFIGTHGIETDGTISATIEEVFVGGQLAPILNIVSDARNLTPYADVIEDWISGNHHWCQNSTYNTYDTRGPTWGRYVWLPFVRESNGSIFGRNLFNIPGVYTNWKDFAVRYLYSYYDTDVSTRIGTDKGRMAFFPWPKQGTNERMWLAPDFDPTGLTQGEFVTIGSHNTEHAAEVPQPRPWVARFKHDGTGAEGNFRYVELSDDVTLELGGETTLPALETIGGQTGPFRMFFQLAWLPAAHKKDPWQLSQSYNQVSDSIEEIYLGVLGDSTNGVFVSDSRQLSDIPDAITDGDFISTIDWDSLNDAFERIHNSERYIMYGSSDLGSLKKLLYQDVTIHGLTPVLELDERVEPKMNRIRFKRIGQVSVSEAEQGGRVIDSSVIREGKAPKIKHNNTWRYSEVELRINYDGKKFEDAIVIDSAEARQAMGGRKSKLKLQSEILNIPGAGNSEYAPVIQQQLARRLGVDLLRPASVPRPSAMIECTISAAIRLAPGRECLITHAGIRNPYTGAYGVTDMPGLIRGSSINWKAGTGRLFVDLAGDVAAAGVGPAVLINPGEAQRLTAGASGTVELRPAEWNNLFSGTERNDLSFFDCLEWNPTTNTYKERTNCSCGDYSVVLVKDDDESDTPVAGTIGSYDTDEHKATVTLDTTGLSWVTIAMDYDVPVPPSSALQMFSGSWIGGNYFDNETQTYKSSSLSPLPAGVQWTTNGEYGPTLLSEATSYHPETYGEIGHIFRGSSRIGRPFEAENSRAEGGIAVDNTILCYRKGWDTERQYVNGEWSSTGVKIDTSNGSTVDAVTRHNGRIWASIGTKAYEYISGSTFTNSFTSTHGSIYYMQDFSGELWFGTSTGYVDSWDGSTITSRARPGSSITGMCVVGGTIYVTIYPSAEVWYWDGSSWSQLTSQSTDHPTAGQAKYVCNWNDEVAWYDSTSEKVYVHRENTNEDRVVLLPGDFDDANTQPCQRKHTYFADGSNKLTDSSATEYPGNRIG